MQDMQATALNRRTGDLFRRLADGQIVRLMYGRLVAGYALPPDRWEEYQALRREREARESK